MAALFGLLALTHAITIWIFAGLLLFCFFYFRPFGLYAAVMLAIFACFYTPWLMRNYHVCGSPFGVSWYSVLSVVRGTEDTIMRSMDPPLSGVSPTFFKRKILSQADYQLGDLFLLLGSIVAAPVFLHRPAARFPKALHLGFSMVRAPLLAGGAARHVGFRSGRRALQIK